MTLLQRFDGGQRVGGQEIAAALSSPDVKKKLHDLNVEAYASTPEQASELLSSEIKRWGAVIVRAKIPQQ